MKRFLSLMLAGIMLLCALAGCSGLKGDDKGPIFNIYLGSELRNWDPAITYNDASAVRFFSLIYSGLMTVDENGNIEKSLAKDITTYQDSKTGEHKMKIEIIDTAWSDGRQLQVEDIIFAWKRIIEPSFSSPAASMLFQIKNARAIRNGDATIDDLGVAAIDTTVLEITFENETDTDLFLEYLASPALVPLREDVVTFTSDWSKYSQYLVASGPFCVKYLDKAHFGETVTLERNEYYMDVEGHTEKALDKDVTPFRILVHYNYDEEMIDKAFSYTEDEGTVSLSDTLSLSRISDKLLYVADITAARADAYDKVNTAESMSLYSYFINTQNPLFENAAVRQALSLAIDRTKISELATGAKPATGLLPDGVFYVNKKTSFREEAGDVLAPTADIEKAKSLLKDAGVTSGEFTLTYKESGLNGNIAQAVKAAWEELGFTVVLEALPLEEYDASFIKNKETGNYNFDVIGLDFQTISTSAFSTLAPFSPDFSGEAVNVVGGDYTPLPHMTQYNSDEYNQLIAQAFTAASREDMDKVLISAEKMLLDDAPVIPVIFNTNAYAVSSDLSNVKSNYYGCSIFTKSKLKNYEEYKPLDTLTAIGEDTTAE